MILLLEAVMMTDVHMSLVLAQGVEDRIVCCVVMDSGCYSQKVPSRR